MIVKGKFKFMLPALLLAASAMAYAEGETDAPKVVTLSDSEKTTISWSDFVKAINNPEQVKGTVAEDNAAKVAWNNAYTRLTTAKDDLEAKKTAKDTAVSDSIAAYNALETAQGQVTQAEKAQSEAATKLKTAQDNYAEAQSEYNEALGNQSKAQQNLNTLNKDLTTAKERKTTLEANLKKNYEDQINAKLAEIATNQKDSLNAAERAAEYTRLMNALVTTTYEEITPEWLTTEYNRAVAFQRTYDICYDNWDGESDYSGNRENYLYYKAAQVGSGRNKRWELTLSFEETHSTGDGWEKAWEDQFDDYLYSIKNSNSAQCPTVLWLDLGSKYPENNGLYKVEAYTNAAPTSILPNAVAALKTLNDTYKEKSNNLIEVVANQALYDEYKASKEEWEAKINGTKNEAGETVTIGYTQANVNLRNELKKLREDEHKDADYIELHGADGNDGEGSVMYSVNTLPGEINKVEEELNGYTTTVDKYTATKDASGNNYIGADNKVVSYLNYLLYLQTSAQAEKTTADSNVQSAQRNENAKQNALNIARTNVANAESAVTAAESEVKTAQAGVDNAQIALDAAQKEADAAASAAAQVKYNEITLSAGSVINATEPITAAYSGTILANGSIFNVNITPTAENAQTSLFKNFAGHVDDAAINGAFASNLVGSSFTDVARWDGNGKIYNEQGVATEYNSDLEDAFGAFGYALRNNKYYGVNFADLKIVLTGEAPSKVFNLTAYDLPAGQDDVNPATKQTYVQLKEKGSSDMVALVNGTVTGYTVPQNRFAQSATADVAGLGLANVYYGTNNTCDLVTIVDRENFFCPVTVNATKIDYGRTLKGGYNSVCLPFTLTTSLSNKILSICEYESVDFDNKKFWFKQNAESIAANTPALIVVNEGATDVKLDIENVVIAATDKSQIVSAKAMNDDSHSYGTLKKADVSEFKGMQYRDYIYGLNTSGEFIAGAATATFPAFRMVIGTNKAVNPKTSARTSAAGGYDVMGIGILDEFGNDITDELVGIKDIAADEATATFKVAGGQGEILFSSEVDFGKVAIYSLDGKVAAMADVVAGTTSVNVQKGLYIVNGKKVLVK